MNTPTTAFFVAAALLLSACAPQSPATTAPTPAPAAPAPRPAAPATAQAPAAPPAVTPPPRTAITDFRKDGDLGARHQRIVDEAKKGGHEIAFIGDSITEGWAGGGKDAWAKAWAPKHAINCGIGGDRTQHVLGRLDHDLLDALAAPNNHITHVVLLIGTNNVFDDSAADIALGVQAITDKLHERLPGAKIILMSVFPRGQWPNPQRDRLDAVNTRLAKFAATHTDYIKPLDINAKYLAAGGEIPHDLMPDYLHLSPGAYQIWSDALNNVVAPPVSDPTH